MTVKEARKIVGLTQQGLSNWLGIPKRTIEDWDSGKSQPREWIKRLLIDKIFSYKGDNKMRVFEVANIDLRNNGEFGDETQEYFGTNIDDAREAYQRACSYYDSLTDYDKKRTCIEARVYSIDGNVNVNDEDELTDALCDCIGYDFFDESIIYNK